MLNCCCCVSPIQRESTEPSCVSIKSDRSMDRPINFFSETHSPANVR